MVAARPASTILVLAPNWLGDSVMALPAIADVRRALPGARLVAAGRRSVAGLFGLVPGVDEVVTLDWNGRWTCPGALRADIARLRAAAPDVALLLPNSFAAAWLTARAGIPQRWGYAADLRSLLLTRAVPRPRGSRHQGAYYQHLTQALDLPAGPLEPVVVVPDRAVAEARALLIAGGWDPSRPLIVFAPGAAYGTAKRWRLSYVSQVAADLVREHGAACAMVGGPADSPAVREVLDGLPADVRGHVADLTGRTSLEALAGVLRLARVSVANDSGAMHLAAAVGTPVVAMFGPTRERETAPLARGGARAEVLINPVWCRPCMLRECPIDHRCMTGITPARAYAAVTSLLSSTR